MRRLSKEKLGDLGRRTKEAYEPLCAVQVVTLTTPNNDAMGIEARAFTKWQILAELEEKYLRQKSKLHWLNVGDKKSIFLPSSESS